MHPLLQCALFFLLFADLGVVASGGNLLICLSRVGHSNLERGAAICDPTIVSERLLSSCLQVIKLIAETKQLHFVFGDDLFALLLGDSSITLVDLGIVAIGPRLRLALLYIADRTHSGACNH